jgi:hypothetical protein
MQPDLMVVSPNTLRVMKQLFNGSSYRRWSADDVANTVEDQLMISGMRVVPDYCISESDGYGKIFMLNSDAVHIEYLPPVLQDGDFVIPVMAGNGETSESVGLPIHVQLMARNGLYNRWSMSLTSQLVVTRPNANGYIGGISLTVS